MRLGIFFNARRDQGGLYQYAVSILHCLHDYIDDYEYVLIQTTADELPFKPRKKNWRVIRPSRAQVQFTTACEALLMQMAKAGFRRLPHLLPVYPAVREAHLDGMIYVKPTFYSFQWPYANIFPIHDLQHRLQPQFPEVGQRSEVERREGLYQNAVRHTRAILADSQVGKEDIVACYGVDERIIFALAYLPFTFFGASGEIWTAESAGRVLKKYQLEPGYLYYPAAFWAHKNHIHLIQALALLKKQHQLEPTLALPGGKKNGYEEVRALVNQLGLAEQVRFLGYIPDADVSALYHGALALVMPTYFGPTNIPVLEAWQAGCPVISSDIRGIREQVGEAGLLVDPNSPQSISDGIFRLASDPALRESMVRKGLAKIKAWQPEDFAARLAEIMKFAFEDNQSDRNSSA